MPNFLPMIIRFSWWFSDSTSSSLSVNEDLSKILQWGYKWKILFNPDTSEQAQEIV